MAIMTASQARENCLAALETLRSAFGGNGSGGLFLVGVPPAGRSFGAHKVGSHGARGETT